MSMMGLNATNIGSIVTSGLIFNFNNAYGGYSGTGTALTDQSGNGNSATLGSGVTYSTDNGGVFTLAGTANNFISLDTSWASGGVVQGSANATTQCVWVRTTATNGAKLIGAQNSVPPTAATAYSNMMWIGTNGFLYGGTYSAGATINNSGVAINDGTWRYCCYVRSTGASSTQLYVNGAAIGSATSPANANETFASGRVIIGGGTTASSTWTNAFSGLGYLACTIGAVQYYSVALTAAQIVQNFNAQRGRYGV